MTARAPSARGRLDPAELLQRINLPLVARRVLPAEWGPAVDRWHRHGPCPMCGGKDRARFDPPGSRGGWFCNHCGACGDLISLVQRVLGVRFPEAFRLIAEAAGLSPLAQGSTAGPVACAPLPAGSLPKPKTFVQALCRRLWAEGRHDHEHALAYVRARGADLAVLPPTVRGHDRLELRHPAGPGGRIIAVLPGLLGILRNEAGDPCGLHRIFLDPVVPRKAEIRVGDGESLSPKRVLSFLSCRGSSILVGEPDDTVDLVEGVENALALYSATGGAAVAAYSAGALPHVKIPPGVRNVRLWPDVDAVGLRYAREAVARFKGEGLKVTVHVADGPGGAA